MVAAIHLKFLNMILLVAAILTLTTTVRGERLFAENFNDMMDSQWVRDGGRSMTVHRHGNRFQTNRHDIGLYAESEDPTNFVSYRRVTESRLPTQNFSIQFDVLDDRQQGRSISEATLKLFGNSLEFTDKTVTSDLITKPAKQLGKLNIDSPWLIEFGPVFDRNLNLVKVCFRGLDSTVRCLLDQPVAPRDGLQHTYKLSWEAKIFAVYIDDVLVSLGSIDREFGSPEIPKLIDDPVAVKPEDWDDKVYIEDLTAFEEIRRLDQDLLESLVDEASNEEKIIEISGQIASLE